MPLGAGIEAIDKPLERDKQAQNLLLRKRSRVAKLRDEARRQVARIVIRGGAKERMPWARFDLKVPRIAVAPMRSSCRPGRRRLARLAQARLQHLPGVVTG